MAGKIDAHKISFETTQVTTMTDESKPTGREFKHATYCKSETSNNDLLVVKEVVHNGDGTSTPGLKFFPNFKRTFYTTQENRRDHKDKKEWEDIKNLKQHTCTQAELPVKVAQALGQLTSKPYMKQLARSPYLYGIDIPTTSLLKDKYQKQWLKAVSPSSSMAVADTETDVVDGHEEIICFSITMKSKAFIAINPKFIGTMIDPVGQVQEAFTKYLGEYQKARGIVLEVYVAKDEADCCISVINKAHEWKPDFLVFWNMLFDLKKIEKALDRANIKMGDVFSDPSVPEEFRFYNFKEGPTHKVTASGRKMLLTPAERWHIVTCPASFYILDAMCLYKRIRIQKGNEIGGYSLDNILNEKLGIRKLSFDIKTKTKLEWHYVMQTKHKVLYMVYNLFDDISIELLDEETGDVSRAFTLLAGISDYSRFKSNPGRIADDLHFFCLDKGKVIATFADTVANELDADVVGTEGWIITLPSHLIDDNGIALIKEFPSIRSNWRSHVADLDIEGTYPNVEDCMNISKSTTLFELSKIRGVGEEERRILGVNMTGGSVNAIEISMKVLKLPSPDYMLSEFLKEMEQEKVVVDTI